MTLTNCFPAIEAKKTKLTNKQYTHEKDAATRILSILSMIGVNSRVGVLKSVPIRITHSATRLVTLRLASESHL